MRLESVISDFVKSSSFSEINPISRGVYIPIQQNLTEEHWAQRKARHVSLGHFYEAISGGLYGGKLTNYRYVPKGEEKNGLFKPDLVSEGLIGESKGCVSGSECFFSDGQIFRYAFAQTLEPNSDIYFAIYRHSVKKIKSYGRSETELFKELAQETYFSIRMPFSLVLAIHSSDDLELICKSKGESYRPGTGLKSPALNGFLFEPERKIFDFSLDPQNYVIERFLSPKEFEVNENLVHPFPIVFIRDKDPLSWRRQFVEKFRPQDYGTEEEVKISDEQIDQDLLWAFGGGSCSEKLNDVPF